jgi:hypothetical protein
MDNRPDLQTALSTAAFYGLTALFFCHPGLEPGSIARCRSLQRAVLNAGSRVFARDDKEGTTTQAIHTS